jgi:hypothetical protein
MVFEAKITQPLQLIESPTKDRGLIAIPLNKNIVSRAARDVVEAGLQLMIIDYTEK